MIKKEILNLFTLKLRTSVYQNKPLGEWKRATHLMGVDQYKKGFVSTIY